MSYFWKLEFVDNPKTIQLKNDLDYDQIFEIAKGVSLSHQTINSVVTEGSKISHIVFAGFVGFYAISSDFKNRLKDGNFSGWKTYPLEVNESSLSEFEILAITGRCDEIDYTKAIPYKFVRFPGGPVVTNYKGISIKGWDGSDLFTSMDSLHIFVSQKVKDSLDSLKIENISFVRLEEVEFDESTFIKKGGKKRIRLF